MSGADCVIDSTSVQQQIAQGQLASKRSGLTRRQITVQLNNIRASCHLGKDEWSDEATGCLAGWLLKKRKVDKRSTPELVVHNTSTSLGAFGCLNSWLRRAGCRVWEGHVGMSGRADMLRSLLPRRCHSIGQTGFNAGHSADLLLEASSQSKMVSFQLRAKVGSDARHASDTGSEFINAKFPSRHTIIYGNSQKTLVRFGHEHACIGPFFDFVLVDGGHSYKCAMADLLNFRPLTRSDGVVVVDDVRRVPKHSWEKGPSKAWRDAVKKGVILELGCKNGLAWGRYSAGDR